MSRLFTKCLSATASASALSGWYRQSVEGVLLPLPRMGFPRVSEEKLWEVILFFFFFLVLMKKNFGCPVCFFFFRQNRARSEKERERERGEGEVCLQILGSKYKIRPGQWIVLVDGIGKLILAGTFSIWNFF